MALELFRRDSHRSTSTAQLISLARAADRISMGSGRAEGSKSRRDSEGSRSGRGSRAAM